MSEDAPIYDEKQRRALWAAGPLSQNFPIRYSNGSQWNELTGFCASCRQPISKENFRGTVHETFRGMHRVEAVGRCGNCRMVTCFRWDIKEDGISGRDQSGNWTTWRAEAKKGPAAWFRKLLRL